MGIRKWFADRSIRRTIGEEKRPFTPLNVHEYRSVGVLYHCDSEETHKKVKVFVDFLRKEIGVRDVMAMAFVDEKEIPSYLIAKLNFVQICRKDLDWKMMPRGNEVANFITEPFDVLIDLSLEDVLPIQYMVAGSRAAFKVGRKEGLNEELNDMLIDMAGSKSLSQYINHVNKYLHMLNAKEQTA